MLEPTRFFKLSNEAGSLGLSCGKGGVALAGVPLLFCGEDGFQPRSEEQIRKLVSDAYGIEADGARLTAGLGAVARALNTGDIAHAMTAAVLLKLPELDWDGAVRIARAEETLAKYSEDQPRDWHGRWTVGSGGDTNSPATELVILPTVNAVSPVGENIEGADGFSDGHPDAKPEGETAGEVSGTGSVGLAAQTFALPDDWIHLPPGQRNDELGDLLEWIANARPEDALAIHHEIDRVYRYNGDITGAFVLHAALSDILEDQGNKVTREEVLRDCEYLTQGDPTQMISYRTLGDAAMLLGLPNEAPPGRSLAIDLAPVEAASPDAELAEAARVEYTRSSVWTQLGWAARGHYFEDTFGDEPDLAPNSPIIDRFPAGVATSFKSLDLDAATYQNAARLSWRINSYVNSVAGFNGYTWGGVIIKPANINGRALNLGIPKGSGTILQNSVIEAARTHAKDLGVNLIVTPF